MRGLLTAFIFVSMTSALAQQSHSPQQPSSSRGVDDSVPFFLLYNEDYALEQMDAILGVDTTARKRAEAERRRLLEVPDTISKPEAKNYKEKYVGSKLMRFVSPELCSEHLEHALETSQVSQSYIERLNAAPATDNFQSWDYFQRHYGHNGRSADNSKYSCHKMAQFYKEKKHSIAEAYERQCCIWGKLLHEHFAHALKQIEAGMQVCSNIDGELGNRPFFGPDDRIKIVGEKIENLKSLRATLGTQLDQLRFMDEQSKTPFSGSSACASLLKQKPAR